MSKEIPSGQTAKRTDEEVRPIGRRVVIQGLAVSGCLAAVGCLAKSAAAQEDEGAASVKPGDRFAIEPEEGSPKPLRLDDLKPGKAVIGVYPIDPTTGKLRNETRLNMVNLIRLETFKPDTAAAAASGVVAFSAICTHKGCNINSWNAEASSWRCFCHMSEFETSHGDVIAGPASEPLPMIAIAIDAEGFVTASTEFSHAPGAAS
jgi:Rieske Fe-S protein